MTTRCQIKGCRNTPRQLWQLKSGETACLCLYHVVLLMSLGYGPVEEIPQ